MGSWSKPSKRLLQSFEVDLFEVAFDEICNVLEEFGINYRWAEKDRVQAETSWRKFNALSTAQRRRIGQKLIAGIHDALRASLQSALDESVPRKIKLVKVVIRSNRGETNSFVFDDLKAAVTFLQSAEEERLLDTANAPTLLKESPKTNERDARDSPIRAPRRNARARRDDGVS